MRGCKKCHMIGVRNKLHQRMEGIVAMNHLRKDDKVVFLFLPPDIGIRVVLNQDSIKFKWCIGAAFHKEHGHKSSKVYYNINKKRYKRNKHPFNFSY